MSHIILSKSRECLVYIDSENPTYVNKVYRVSRGSQSLEQLKELREKLIALKSYSNLPDFQIRPLEISDIKNDFFKITLPYIKGITLDKAVINPNYSIDLSNVALFISDLEKGIMSSSETVFPDIANGGNILITDGLQNNNIWSFMILDPDDIQFANYKSNCCSRLVIPEDSDKDYCAALGLSKCFTANKKGVVTFNKNLDVRSLFALIFYFFDSKKAFYYSASDSLSEYEQKLRIFGIPENSSLYEKAILTLTSSRPSNTIDDSIFELANEGYTMSLMPNGQRKLNKS